LLSREQAARYCGISPNLFDETVGKDVAPIELQRRKLWDVRMIDRWIDGRRIYAKDGDPRSISERLNGGVPGAGR
jgi:hypothetical protein